MMVGGLRLLFEAGAWLVRWLTALNLFAAGALFVASLVLYAAEITMRGFLGTSYPEYYELVGFAFIYVFLLGAAALYARNEDITIDLVYQRLPAVMGKWLILAVYVVMAVVLLIVLVNTRAIIDLQMHTPTPLLGWPEAIKWFPLAAASAVIALACAVEALAAVLWIVTGERPLVWRRPFFDLEDELEQGEAI